MAGTYFNTKVGLGPMLDEWANNTFGLRPLLDALDGKPPARGYAPAHDGMPPGNWITYSVVSEHPSTIATRKAALKSARAHARKERGIERRAAVRRVASAVVKKIRSYKPVVKAKPLLANALKQATPRHTVTYRNRPPALASAGTRPAVSAPVKKVTLTAAEPISEFQRAERHRVAATKRLVAGDKAATVPMNRARDRMERVALKISKSAPLSAAAQSRGLLGQIKTVAKQAETRTKTAVRVRIRTRGFRA